MSEEKPPDDDRPLSDAEMDELDADMTDLHNLRNQIDDLIKAKSERMRRENRRRRAAEREPGTVHPFPGRGLPEAEGDDAPGA